jgi:hypothetical protein
MIKRVVFELCPLHGPDTVHMTVVGNWITLKVVGTQKIRLVFAAVIVTSGKIKCGTPFYQNYRSQQVPSVFRLKFPEKLENPQKAQ